MSNWYQEKKLEFNFSDFAVEKLDEQDIIIPEGMSLVDFVVEDPKLTFLIQVKDPASTKEQFLEPEQSKFIKSMQNNDLIAKLTPNARDSYCYLHLMDRDEKRFVFVVIIGIDKQMVSPELLLNFKERLFARIKKEAHIPWVRKHIHDCLVLLTDNIKALNSSFSVRRVS